MAGEKLGKRSTWGVMYTSDRPRDVLKVTEAVEAKIMQASAIVSMDQAGNSIVIPRIVWNDTSAPADFAVFNDLPVGSTIETPLVSGIFGYQKISVANGSVLDWNKIAKASV